MTRPYVTVLIDTYNHERFIEQAITSVLEQDFPAADREILVVDDSSTDRTPHLVRRFEPHVRLLRKPNGGQASAFNAGLPESRGEVVAFLDGDDWWVNSKLSKVIPVFEAEPAVGIVGHGTTEVFPNGDQHTEVLVDSPRYRLDSPAGARLFRIRKSFLGTRSTIRRSVLAQLLPVPEGIRVQADEFIFTMAAALSDVQILPEALFFYRLHAANNYMLQGSNREGLRRKVQSLSLLAGQLRVRLARLGVPEETIGVAVHAIEVEARQLRLIVHGGFPWETVGTELASYRISHSDAPWSHRIFKHVGLIPALFLPPRTYYAAKRRLAAAGWYLRARKYIFPVPQPGHAARTWRSGS